MRWIKTLHRDFYTKLKIGRDETMNTHELYVSIEVNLVPEVLTKVSCVAPENDISNFKKVNNAIVKIKCNKN